MIRIIEEFDERDCNPYTGEPFHLFASYTCSLCDGKRCTLVCEFASDDMSKYEDPTSDLHEQIYRIPCVNSRTAAFELDRTADPLEGGLFRDASGWTVSEDGDVPSCEVPIMMLMDKRKRDEDDKGDDEMAWYYDGREIAKDDDEFVFWLNGAVAGYTREDISDELFLAIVMESLEYADSRYRTPSRLLAEFYPMHGKDNVAWIIDSLVFEYLRVGEGRIPPIVERLRKGGIDPRLEWRTRNERGTEAVPVLRRRFPEGIHQPPGRLIHRMPGVRCPPEDR